MVKMRVFRLVVLFVKFEFNLAQHLVVRELCMYMQVPNLDLFPTGIIRNINKVLLILIN